MLNHTMRKQNAFSLIEALAVVVVLAVLVALLLPVLSASRSRAQDVASVANMHQHGVALAGYASDSDDFFPYLAGAWSSTEPVMFVCCGQEAYPMPFFSAAEFWIVALTDRGYLEGAPFDGPSSRHPGSPSWYDGGHLSDYLLSATTYTRPEFWDEFTRLGASQWQGVRIGESRFPSRKTVVIEWHPRWGQPTIASIRRDHGNFGSLFVDGAASRHSAKAFAEPYPNGEGFSNVGGRAEFVFFYGIAGVHTRKGVSGFDLAP